MVRRVWLPRRFRPGLALLLASSLGLAAASLAPRPTPQQKPSARGPSAEPAKPPAETLITPSGLRYGRVLLQGFYWESYRHGLVPGYGQRRWYTIVREQVPAIAAAGFDLVWLPPPSWAGERSAGYNPKHYFRLDNSYGTAQQHRALLVALLQAGIDPVADLVLNHRDGERGWADFSNPAWGPWAICASDEAFRQGEAHLAATPLQERGACEESVPYRAAGTLNYPAFRDIAHNDPRVRRDILRYLLLLRSYGYRGWRYDMAHGYGGRWIACYNAATQPTFSVGETDWGAQGEQRGWIWASAGAPPAPGRALAHLARASSAFDFGTYFQLRQAIPSRQPESLAGWGRGTGLVGDSTDGLPWRSRAVTFVENHDTGYRTDDDGQPQPGHQFDSFARGWQVEQAYAFLLTHPGLPSVYWKHYFDWGAQLQGRIRALIAARKAAGVHAGSHLQPLASAPGLYAARIDGSRGRLYLRLGGSDALWQPRQSGDNQARPLLRGQGWVVWLTPTEAAAPAQPLHRSALPVNAAAACQGF